MRGKKSSQSLVVFLWHKNTLHLWTPTPHLWTPTPHLWAPTHYLSPPRPQVLSGIWQDLGWCAYLHKMEDQGSEGVIRGKKALPLLWLLVQSSRKLHPTTPPPLNQGTTHLSLQAGMPGPE